MSNFAGHASTTHSQGNTHQFESTLQGGGNGIDYL